MCGIAGFITGQTGDSSNLETLDSMTAALKHRGPDSSGMWNNPEQTVWLGHARLAIQDVSPAGHQPMVSASGNYVLSYNGEIYNHLELREELSSQASHTWVGTSDTETLLCAIDAWGLPETLRKARGMFAFLLYDLPRETLTLVRDRFGEKPLYFGYQGKDFLCASDLASLKVHPCFNHEVDRAALAQYFLYGYVPSPASIYHGIYKLLPGHYATLSHKDFHHRVGPQITEYWSYQKLLTQKQTSGNSEEAKTQVHSTLRSVVADQMISDVPLGSFLSGGIDSSVITALAQEVSHRPINTFTIGSTSLTLDESGYASDVAAVLGTHHTEFIITDAQAHESVPLIGGIYSEPFADSSQIPTFIVSQMAQTKVTVALTGDGGDEIFGGYNRYLRGLTTWQRTRRLPLWLRQGLQKVALSRSPSEWNGIFGGLSKRESRFGVANLENKIEKLSAILSADDLVSYYTTLTEKWRESPLTGGQAAARTPSLQHLKEGLALDQARRLMLVDALTYLPDDILVKVDRASMASSLETRAPFLDLKVVEIAAALDTSTLLTNNTGKAPLREILRKYLPSELIDRPKLGFGIPLGDWLRGPLRPWVESLIDQEHLHNQGFLNPAQVGDIWTRHLAHSGNHEEQLWAVIVFQLWLTHNPRAQ